MTIEKYFSVDVSCGEKGAELDLGHWRVLASSASEARALAIAKQLEPSLKWMGPADRRQKYQIKQLPRFLVSPGWGHIFNGFFGGEEKITRWILDRSTDTLVSAQIVKRDGRQWLELPNVNKADLLQSLKDNDIPTNPEAFEDDVFKVNKPPTWAIPMWESIEGPRTADRAARIARAAIAEMDTMRPGNTKVQKTARKAPGKP